MIESKKVVLACTGAVLLLSNTVGIRSARAETADCFVCDDFKGTDGSYYHTDTQLAINTHQGGMHSTTATGNCNQHTVYFLGG